MPALPLKIRWVLWRAQPWSELMRYGSAGLDGRNVRLFAWMRACKKERPVYMCPMQEEHSWGWLVDWTNGANISFPDWRFSNFQTNVRMFYVLVKFQVLTAANMNITVFLNISSCSLVEIYRRFRGAFCFHHQDDESPLKHCSISIRLHGAVSQKTVIFVYVFINMNYLLVICYNRSCQPLETGTTFHPSLSTCGRLVINHDNLFDRHGSLL
jgi:hypothetical protein